MNSDNPIYLKIFCIIFPKEKKKERRRRGKRLLIHVFLTF